MFNSFWKLVLIQVSYCAFISAVKPRNLVGATFLKFLAGTFFSCLYFQVFVNRFFILMHSLLCVDVPLCCFYLSCVLKMTRQWISIWSFTNVKFFHLHFSFALLSKLFPFTENESAFDLLYCITFKLMDNQWLAMRASYMDFNVCVFSLLKISYVYEMIKFLLPNQFFCI